MLRIITAEESWAWIYNPKAKQQVLVEETRDQEHAHCFLFPLDSQGCAEGEVRPSTLSSAYKASKGPETTWTVVHAMVLFLAPHNIMVWVSWCGPQMLPAYNKSTLERTICSQMFLKADCMANMEEVWPKAFVHIEYATFTCQITTVSDYTCLYYLTYFQMRGSAEYEVMTNPTSIKQQK